MTIDPVCQTSVDERKSAGRSHFEGVTYFFCSMRCKHKFEENPELYLEEEVEYSEST